MAKETAKIKNRLKQPLSLNLSEGTVYFNPREVKELPVEELQSTEIKKLVDMGDLVVVRIG